MFANTNIKAGYDRHCGGAADMPEDISVYMSADKPADMLADKSADMSVDMSVDNFLNVFL